MNPLASRKLLLIAESELNRAQLAREWHTLADEVHALKKQAGTIRSLASTAVSLVGVLASFRNHKPAPADGKSSWWQTLLKGVQWAGPIWSEFRARPKS